jgi:hypothetical protein
MQALSFSDGGGTDESWRCRDAPTHTHTPTHTPTHTHARTHTHINTCTGQGRRGGGGGAAVGPQVQRRGAPQPLHLLEQPGPGQERRRRPAHRCVRVCVYIMYVCVHVCACASLSARALKPVMHAVVQRALLLQPSPPPSKTRTHTHTREQARWRRPLTRSSGPWRSCRRSCRPPRWACRGRAGAGWGESRGDGASRVDVASAWLPDRP